MASLLERYEAAMVLSGTGDSLGYKNGSWEFCHSGTEIYKELVLLGGLKKIKLKCPDWMVSDDTVMLLATGEALSSVKDQLDKEELFAKIAQNYKDCMRDMAGRAPGACCSMAVHKLKPLRKNGYHIPFNPRGGGCGAAMRSMCIGLRYPRPSDLTDLVAVSVESGRMTHHHPTGYLGSLASALFTALALQGVPLREWGRCLLDTLPMALSYVEETGRAVEENKKEWSYFKKAWTDYLTARKILDGKSNPVFPEPFGFAERDKFYESVSYSGWGGSSGHDAPMIAYDALLGANWDWEELCKRAMFHGGDSDSTGIIAACCYGATQGFRGVPHPNHKYIEYRDRLVKLAHRMFKLAYPDNMESITSTDAKSATEASTAESQESTSTTHTDSNQHLTECSVSAESDNGTAETKMNQGQNQHLSQDSVTAESDMVQSQGLLTSQVSVSDELNMNAVQLDVTQLHGQPMSQVSESAKSDMSQSQGQFMSQVSATAESEMSQSRGQPMSQVSATAESEMSQSQGRLMSQVSATAESEMSQSHGQLMSQISATAESEMSQSQGQLMSQISATAESEMSQSRDQPQTQCSVGTESKKSPSQGPSITPAGDTHSSKKEAVQ